MESQVEEVDGEEGQHCERQWNRQRERTEQGGHKGQKDQSED